VHQSLKLCVKFVELPSVYVTVKVCDVWLPLTAVASSFSVENWPAGRGMVVLLTESATLTGPRL